MEKLPKSINKKEKNFNQKIKTAILAGASMFLPNLAIAENVSKENIKPTNRLEQVRDIDFENGKDNLRKVFEIISGNRRDKDGEDLLIHLGGSDGFYRLTPSFLKELVILSDINNSKDPRIFDMEMRGLALRVKNRITKEAEKVLGEDLTKDMKEIRQSIIETGEQMK